jgi:uncharacterized protein (DUF1499 family)
MLRLVRRTAWLLLLAATLAFAGFAATTREDSVLALIYEAVFGPPDLGPVDFGTMARRRRPNDALACPAGLCDRAEPDFSPPVFALSEDELRERLTAAILREPGVTPVYRDARPGLPAQDRYVARSALMSYPDTIDVRYVPLAENRATLALYSRSQIGIRDFGVNLARVRRWTDPAFIGAEVAR